MQCSQVSTTTAPLLETAKLALRDTFGSLGFYAQTYEIRTNYGYRIDIACGPVRRTESIEM